MYSYNDDILKKLQETELKMLKVVDELCNEYNIPYFVTFGTAIGAARHQGFIPWDDDIDIGMMRDDYYRFRAIPIEKWNELDKDLILVDPSDEFPLHRSIYPRVYKQGTIFETEYHYKYSNMKNITESDKLPIWLDIFLYDKVDSIKEVKKKSKKTFILRKLYYYSKCNINVVTEDPLKLKILCIVKKIIFYILNLMNLPEKIIHESFVNCVSKDCGEYITSFEFDFIDETIASFCRYEDIFPVKRLPFGDIFVPMQKNYSDILHSLYGDYLLIPSEDKRYNHPPKILDFGDGINVMEVENGDI